MQTDISIKIFNEDGFYVKNMPEPRGTYFLFLMFCSPCIMTYPYNTNQQDELFPFNLFR